MQRVVALHPWWPVDVDGDVGDDVGWNSEPSRGARVQGQCRRQVQLGAEHEVAPVKLIRQ
jgi:hypothetical protein